MATTQTGTFMKIRLHSILQTTLLLVTFFSSAVASAYDMVVDGIYYNKNGTKLTVTYKTTGYNSYSGNVSIPSTLTYNGTTYSVIAIGANAFYGCTGLKEVVIPNTVTTIGDRAFCNCVTLTTMTMSNTVVTIGTEAFCNCEVLPSVTIPKSVTKLGTRAFKGCTSLKTLNFNAESCADFSSSNGYRPFDDLNISTINIGNSVKRIPAYFVNGLSGFQSLKIPESVSEIGVFAFYKCTGLMSIKVESSNSSYDTRNNCNAIISTSTNTLIVGCKKTVIPNSVTSIGEYALFGCIGLKTVNIPNSVTEIGKQAFSGCIDLTSLTVGNSVMTIGTDAFKECIALSSIKVALDNQKYDSRDNCNAIIETETNSLIIGCQNTVIPNTVTKIYKNAFYRNTFLNDFTIPEGITYISEEAFRECTFNTICFNAIKCGDFYYESASNRYPPFYKASIKYVILDKNVKQIPKYFLWQTNSGIEAVVSLSTSAPKGGFSMFTSGYPIYVPSVSNYKNQSYWYQYSIQPIYTVVPKVTRATVTTTDPFSLSEIVVKGQEGHNNSTFYAQNNALTISDLIPRINNPIELTIGFNSNTYLIEDHIYPDIEFTQCELLSATQTTMNTSFSVSRDSGFWIDGCGVDCNSKSYSGEIKNLTLDKYYIDCSITGLSPNTSYGLSPWVEYNGVKYYGDYTLIKTKSISTNFDGKVGPTSVKYTVTYNSGDAHVKDAYFTFQGKSCKNLLETGLEPVTLYNYSYTIMTSNGNQYQSYSFKTSSLQMQTQTARMLTNTTAMLMAETNMADEETSCGFEWRRYDAPEEMPSTKVYCPVYGGTMAGTLKNLSENVYYKYRPFYKSSKGNEYYGDWIAFITADAGVEFEPVVYTYSSPEVSQTEATLQGVALRGSDDITEQGFEYWQVGRNNMLTASNVKKVTAKGERMSATVTGLQPGTAYKFRAYAIAGGKTTRGAEVDFVTESTGLDVNADGVVNIADMNVIINVILRGNNDRTCDVNGDGLVNISDLNAIISAILAN